MHEVNERHSLQGFWQETQLPLAESAKKYRGHVIKHVPEYKKFEV